MQLSQAALWLLVSGSVEGLIRHLGRACLLAVIIVYGEHQIRTRREVISALVQRSEALRQPVHAILRPAAAAVYCRRRVQPG